MPFPYASSVAYGDPNYDARAYAKKPKQPLQDADIDTDMEMDADGNYAPAAPAPAPARPAQAQPYARPQAPATTSIRDAAHEEFRGSGAKANAFMRVEDPYGGKVRFRTRAPMTAEQRSAIEKMALDEHAARGRVGARMSSNGIEYEFAPQGPIIDDQRAARFLALAKQQADQKERDRRLAMEEARNAETVENERAMRKLTQESAAADLEGKRFGIKQKATDAAYQTRQRHIADTREGQSALRSQIASNMASENPSKRAEAMRQLAALDSDAQVGPAPTVEGLPGAGAMTGALARAFTGYRDKQRSDIAGNPLFAADPNEQAAYDQRRKTELAAIARKPVIDDIKAARDVIATDPAVTPAMADIRRTLAKLGDLPAQQDIAKWMADVPVLSIVQKAGELVGGYGTNTTLSDDDAGQVAAKVGQLVKELAGRYPGISPESIKNLLVSELMPTMGESYFDPTRRDQITKTLTGPMR